MIRHETQIRVRYSETDQMGYVYYGNYAQYYEIARVEAMRAAGIRYADLEREYGIWLPVVSMNVRYLRPAAYDDLLTLRTFVHPIEGSHLRFDTEVFNEGGQLLNAARVTLCFVDSVTRKRTSAPAWIIQKLAGTIE
ncbi:MAG: acyl-CoA thioesterase [Saprospiraceae bacterium]|nr:acyl-CoA thioesterase [Saprospiraceae bacterium]